jgi:hypothetical protein
MSGESTLPLFNDFPIGFLELFCRCGIFVSPFLTNTFDKKKETYLLSDANISAVKPLKNRRTRILTQKEISWLVIRKGQHILLHISDP